MSKNYLPGLVIICSFMAAGSHAQNPTDYFTPYGFQLPNLQKGEYLVSLWGNYYDYSDKLQPENPDDINRNSSHHQYFTFRGVYAFTDILLLRVQLVFNPSRVQYEYEYANQSAVPIYRLNRQIPNSYINPYIGIGFKPNTSLEIYGNVDFSGYSYIEKSYSDPALGGYIAEKHDYEHKSITIGVNNLGKL